MVSAAISIDDLRTCPNLRAEVDELVAANLPNYMTWASPGNWRWHQIYTLFPMWQLVARSADGQLYAALNAVPIHWSGRISELPAGYDEVVVSAVATGPNPMALTECQLTASSLCLLSISVRSRIQGQGMAGRLLEEIKARAAADGLFAVIAPLRPIHKSRFPLVDIRDYARWRNSAGEPFDPWVRAHTRVGGEILGVAARSIVIVQPWQRWADEACLSKGEDGRWLPPGGLVPLELDEKGRGVYAEPNIWICHRLGNSQLHKYKTEWRPDG